MTRQRQSPSSETSRPMSSNWFMKWAKSLLSCISLSTFCILLSAPSSLFYFLLIWSVLALDNLHNFLRRFYCHDGELIWHEEDLRACLDMDDVHRSLDRIEWEHFSRTDFLQNPQLGTSSWWQSVQLFLVVTTSTDIENLDRSFYATEFMEHITFHIDTTYLNWTRIPLDCDEACVKLSSDEILRWTVNASDRFCNILWLNPCFQQISSVNFLKEFCLLFRPNPDWYPYDSLRFLPSVILYEKCGSSFLHAYIRNDSRSTLSLVLLEETVVEESLNLHRRR